MPQTITQQALIAINNEAIRHARSPCAGQRSRGAQGFFKPRLRRMAAVDAHAVREAPVGLRTSAPAPNCGPAAQNGVETMGPDSNFTVSADSRLQQQAVDGGHVLFGQRARGLAQLEGAQQYVVARLG